MLLISASLESNKLSNNIFQVTELHNRRRKAQKSRQPFQWKICQLYDHTKSYCKHTPHRDNVVKFISHHTVNFKNFRELPAKYALCFGVRTAKILRLPCLHKKKFQDTKHSVASNKYVSKTVLNVAPTKYPNAESHKKSYAKATKNQYQISNSE